MGVENPNKPLRGRKKENIPPCLNRDATPKQRNIQKNVNINLFWDSFSDVPVFHRSSRAAVPASNCIRPAAHGKPPVVSIRGAKPHRRTLVQTNLSCPYRPSWDLPTGVSGGPTQQQSNLEAKLGCCRLENVACKDESSCLLAVDHGQGLNQVRLENSPKNDFSGRRQYWSQKPREGRCLRGVLHSCNDISKSRTQNKDPHVLKHQRGGPFVSKGSSRIVGALGDSFCSTNFYERPSACIFLNDQRLCPENPGSSFSSSPPGSALTLDHLRSPTSVKSPPTSTGLHVLLGSSQVSADLHSSIQRLKQETASMGALSSFPCESKSVPLPHLSHFDPQGSTLGSVSPTEQLDGGKSCAKQASVKWQSTFARGWGPGSTPGSLEELHPVGYRCRNAGLYARPLEAPDQFWPLAFCGGVASTSLLRRGEETCSSSSVCNLGCCSQVQEVLERGDLSGHLKPHYHQRRLDPELLSSRFFHCPELRRGDTLLCLPSFDGLEVSLETLCARAPVNVGVTVDGTPREVHVTVRAPEVDQLGDGSEYVDLQGLPHELAGADRGPPTVQTVDKGAFFLPAHNSLAEIPGRRLRERSSAVMGCLIPSSIGGSAPSSKNPSNDDCWADVGGAGAEESSGEMNTESSECQRREEGRHGMDTVQQEALKRNRGSTDVKRNRLPQQNTLLLARCFAAWRDQVLDRRAAAQVLYERQLLRKGFTALKWAVELRRIEVGVAWQRHNRTVLAASFRKWQGAVAKQRKERAAWVEKETHSRSSPAAPGGETVAKCPVLWQLSSKCRDATAQYGRAEGNLWMQIIHNQGVDKLHGKAQAIRDMRRLAAAFRLWRLQKESLDEEESRARDARALLEKKRLRNAFRTWQSHHRATERVLPLMAQIQRRLVSQCFNTWKGFAEREACIRSSLDQRRIGVLRLCFQQWALMVQLQEWTRKTLLKLLALRRRIAYARFGFTLDSPATQPHLNVGRQSRRNAPSTVDGLYVALVRQEMFYTWKARWRQHQRLDAFRQAAKQRLLKTALGQWRRWSLCPPPLRSRPGNLDAESVFTSLDLEECSASSGFHSNTPARPTSSDSLERESTLTGSSPGSVSSLVTIADSGPFLHLRFPSLTPSPGREGLGGEAAEFRVGASSPSRNINRKDGITRDPFQSPGFLSRDRRVHATPVPSSWEAGTSGRDETDVFENQRRLLARCFTLWSSQTLQNLRARWLRRRTLLSRAFISWSVATARTSAQDHAQACLESPRQQQQLLAFCFGRWKAAVWRAQLQREEEESLRRGPAGFWAAWRWRKAIRGRQALRMNTGTVVQQSCNYWTKAAAFQLCLRERSSLVGAPKFMKMPLSWPSKQRRSREEGLTPSLGVRARLNGSAFHVWLMIYRSQSRAAGPSQQGPPDSPGRAEWRVEHAQPQNSSAEMGSMKWLWRKYLGLWRRNILLRRFQDARMMRHLVRAWLLWKDACRAEWVVQTLARQRLTQWGWKMWRRRYLQTQVAERFLESQDRSLLRRAFETWRRLPTTATAGPEEAFKSPSQLHATPWQI